MKIGIILGDFYKEKQGGAEIQMALLIDQFIGMGHDVFYIAYGNRETPEVMKNGLRLYNIRRPFRGYKFLIYLRKKELFSILDKEEPDVLYQRGDFHFWDIINRYGVMKDIPVVSGLSMERHCVKNKPKIGPSFFFDILTERMKTRYYHNSTLIISQTEHQKEMIMDNFGKKSIIIENGHPIPEGPFIKNKEKLILWVANIKPIKQPELFIDLARALNGKGYIFKMIGRPDEKTIHDLIERSVSEINDLEYLGELPLDKTNKYLENASILVNTSRSEGFSNTYIQAWLRETPVFTINADPDGIIERFKLGARSSSIKQLIKTVNIFLKKDDLLRDAGKRARKFAIEKYDIKKKAEQYANAFERLKKDKDA